jgi:hypothetical protein
MPDEEFLLRNLASIHIQQEAYSDPGDCQLHCFVLKRRRFLGISRRSVQGDFFYAPTPFEYLTPSMRQIKLCKIRNKVVEDLRTMMATAGAGSIKTRT